MLILMLLPAIRVGAQDVASTAGQVIADIFEQYAAENEEAMDYDSFYEELINYARNPMDLNKATREQLERLPFLSDQQVENILSYIYRFGPFRTVYELQLVEELDMTDIRRLLPFIVVSDTERSEKKIYMHDLLNYGKNELLLRVDRGLETKEGYQILPEEQAQGNNKKYLGNQLYHSFRYRFHLRDRVQAGFAAEKDAGEQFWGPVQKGYDFYSATLQLNNFGRFRTIVAGDFRANFGQGLVLRHDFGIGKSSYVLNVSPRNSGLKKYNSTDEVNFFRGAGTTIRVGRVDVTAFYSNKMIDGDTAGHSFSSQYKTGLHRTLGEWRKKQTVNQQVMGGNATLNIDKLQVGITAVHTRLDTRLEPDKAVYNYFYFSGDRQTTAGAHYRMRWHRINFFGETAITDRGATATLNGFSISPVSQLSFVVLQRYYSPGFDTFYANAFSESSRINNESGLYIGAEIRPLRKWRLSAYADSYRFPWPKFGIDAPSIGTDYLVQADFAPRRNLTMFWRFKTETRQSNLSGSTVTLPVLQPNRKTSLRYNLAYNTGDFVFRNIVEANLYRKGDATPTYGVIASQDVSYKFPRAPLKLDFRVQYFDAVDYDNRFYSYERDVLYAFSIPMYYGLGSRYYLNLRYELNQHLSLWFKIAQTVYADGRESLSSGNESITGNRKTDVRFMLKWDF